LNIGQANNDNVPETKRFL